MSKRKSYQTEQKDMILTFLSKHQGGHISAGMILDHMKEAGCSISMATIYRNLDKFVDSGMLLKYNLPEETGSYYHLAEQPSARSVHCFLVCVKCGKVIPLSNQNTASFFTHIRAHQQFELNQAQVFLYGKCAVCMHSD